MGNAVTKPNVEEIMAEIRRQVEIDLANGSKLAPYRPIEISQNGNGRSQPLILSEELNYLNANWNNWTAQEVISSHRPIIGPLIVRFKRYIIDQVWNSLLKGYFERERNFQMNLVRHLNATARYVDSKTTDNFHQLIKKIDAEVQGLNERFDRLFDEANATTRAVELQLADRMGKVEADRNALVEIAERTSTDIEQLDDLIRGLERTVALLARPERIEQVFQPSLESSDIPLKPNAVLGEGVDYLLLENRYRGSEEIIKERAKDYIELFADLANNDDYVVVDLGCGRGEFLELLEEAGIAALGIDQDQAMVARCHQKNLPVIRADGLEYLARVPDHSLGGLFAAQVVEHLTKHDLERLVELAHRKVRPGGKIVFETINPQSVTALSRNFFRDPTHVWPLHPDTLRFVMEMKGLKTERIILSSPYPQEAILQQVELSEHLPARWRATLQSLNDNVKRLNDLLFGHQDYAIVATVPASGNGVYRNGR